MFGKSLSEYVAFQRPILMLIAVVWFVRLAASLVGIPVAAAQYVSVTGVLVIGSLWYGWAVGQKGFGSFKQLYALNLVQGIFSQTLVAAAIVLAMLMGQDNIFTIPEFYPPSAGGDALGMPASGRSLAHAVSHLVVGAVVFPVLGWVISSVTLVATRQKA